MTLLPRLRLHARYPDRRHAWIGLVADAFVVAFRFPNLFRRLFGEGAFNSAFVPIFAKNSKATDPKLPGASPKTRWRALFRTADRYDRR
ncbi:lipid II flippase MurJ [Bradyrhizobium sp. RDI18]|uniref:lipid II flippase MurJ n=1 Tax=Bradyrhizobium sp. RDI18 TaxID=3367400 RepID=UPI00371E831F